MLAAIQGLGPKESFASVSKRIRENTKLALSRSRRSRRIPFEAVLRIVREHWQKIRKSTAVRCRACVTAILLIPQAGAQYRRMRRKVWHFTYATKLAWQCLSVLTIFQKRKTEFAEYRSSLDLCNGTLPTGGPVRDHFEVFVSCGRHVLADSLNLQTLRQSWREWHDSFLREGAPSGYDIPSLPSRVESSVISEGGL